MNEERKQKLIDVINSISDNGLVELYRLAYNDGYMYDTIFPKYVDHSCI